MAQKFHERFNIEVGLDEARRRFVNRAHNAILHDILDRVYSLRGHGPAWDVERFVCTKLGEQWSGYGCLSSIMGEDFYLHAQALEALSNHPEARGKADIAIKQILNDSEIDVGIRWDNGHFLPSGAPLLDEKLVNDVLGCLGSPKYEGVRKPLQKGLEHFLQSVGKPQFLADVVTDMYEALEALAKIVTGRNKDLSSNAELFIAAVKASDGYKPLLKEYIAYANTIRHAGKEGKPKPPLSKKEVESFIYLTGLFIRFATMQDQQV